MIEARPEAPGTADRLRRLLWAVTGNSCICLLYTSDAADERSSVDLGGRRIIKKKKKDSNVTYAHPIKNKMSE